MDEGIEQHAELPTCDQLVFFDVDNLPSFVRQTSAGVDFFAVEPSGYENVDLQRGHALALEALAYARTYRNSVCINYALHAITKRGRIGLLEAAFIGRVSEAAMAASLN